MGHRANLIVVRDGRYDLRYSHWAANTLPCDLFWGPSHAIAFAEAQPDAGSDWLDDIWAEGGAVIDADRRIFRVFGGEDLRYEVPLRRLYLALLAVVWRGWDVGWADDGIADLADHVGYPRERVLVAEHDDPTAPDLRPPERPGRVDLVGSVRRDDGSLKLLPMAGRARYHLMNGPPLAAAAASAPGLERLSLADPGGSFPSGGFHLELGARRLEYWAACDRPGSSARIAARWAGWSVTWLGDRYEDQLAACAGRLAFAEPGRDALFDQLRSILLHRPAGSPIDALLRLAERDRAAGKAVEINPSALRDDRAEPPDDRGDILDRAAKSLGLP